jgi:serine protease Do
MSETPLMNEIGEAVRRAAAAAEPSLASVGGSWRGASGVVLGPGQVLTTARAVHREPPRVRVAGGEPVEGRVLGVDADANLGVVAADTGEAPQLEWAAEPARVGDPVFALAALAGGELRVTFGLVSAVGRSFRGPRGRRITGSIEHTAAVGRGSSGGPLVNVDGQLVGLTSVRLEGGLTLAVAADSSLRERAQALARGESPARRSLGVGVLPPRMARRMRRNVGLTDRPGLLVRDVEEGSPADRAGVLPGDLIAVAGDGPISSADDLYAALDAAAEGGSLRLGLVRGEQERDVDVAFS